MKHVGSVKRVQGGSCREGFRVPRSIEKTENARLGLIIDRLNRNLAQVSGSENRIYLKRYKSSENELLERRNLLIYLNKPTNN